MRFFKKNTTDKELEQKYKSLLARHQKLMTEVCLHETALAEANALTDHYSHMIGQLLKDRREKNPAYRYYYGDFDDLSDLKDIA